MGFALAAFRSALFFLFLVVTIVPWATAAVIYSIFVHGERLYWVCAGWLRLAVWGARVICGVRARVLGYENLPDSPVVMLPKHQSAWETLAFPSLMPHPLCYVFKRELLYIPFFGWAMARMDLIHIDRSKRAEAWAKVAEQGRRYMAEEVARWKPVVEKMELKVRYIGFDIPSEFVVGYGLDYAERYRDLPFVGLLKPEVYAG